MMSNSRNGRPHSLPGCEDSQQPHYKIGTIAALLGVSANVLRTWERRYPLFRASRQAGKQRLYSHQDLQLLRRVVELVGSGFSVSEVMGLGREQLLKPVDAHPDIDGLELGEVPPEVRQSVLELARLPATGLPRQRFAGESLGVSLQGVHFSDAAILQRLYQRVKGLYELWTYMEHRVVASILAKRLQEFRDPLFRSEVCQLGSHTPGPSPLLQAAWGCARQGAFLLLAEEAAAIEVPSASRADLRLAVSLARDHAKMLRNAFEDLDPSLREADEYLKAHDLAPILLKLTHLRRLERMGQVGSDYRGFISSRCLETSTLDRLIYRCLHACDSPPSLWVVPVGRDLVRWAFQTPQGAQLDLGFLSQVVGQSLGCSPSQALARGYLGQRQLDGWHWLWFHWPAYDPPPDAERCSCHPLKAQT